MTAPSHPLADLLGAGLGAVRTLGLATAVAGVAVLGLAVATPDDSSRPTTGPTTLLQLAHEAERVVLCVADAHVQCVGCTAADSRR